MVLVGLVRVKLGIGFRVGLGLGLVLILHRWSYINTFILGR